MELQEIEERVAASLEAMNSPEELYDWRLTHYNKLDWENVQEGCYRFGQNQISELDLKSLIGVYRDKCHVAFTDFHIKVPEPGPGEFARMDLLFGPLDPLLRLVPPREEGERRAYLQVKTLNAMRMTMEHKQVISEKLRQQFNWLMIKAKVKAPELLAVNLKLESYNPYQKKLAPAPAVVLGYHLNEQEQTKHEETPPAPIFTSNPVDNSSFEARLAPAPVKAKARTTMRARATEFGVEREMIILPSENLTPHELPAEIHEEFAAYCQNLYEKAKGN